MSDTNSTKEQELAEICETYQYTNYFWFHNIKNFYANASNPVKIIKKFDHFPEFPIFEPYSEEEIKNNPLIGISKNILESDFLFNLLLVGQFSLWESFNKASYEKLSELQSSAQDFNKFAKKPNGDRASKAESIKINLKNIFNLTVSGDWKKFLGYYQARNCIVHCNGYLHLDSKNKYINYLSSNGLPRSFIFEKKDKNFGNRKKLVPILHDVEFIFNFIDNYIFELYDEITNKYQIRKYQYLNQYKK